MHTPGRKPEEITANTWIRARRRPWISASCKGGGTTPRKLITRPRISAQPSGSCCSRESIVSFPGSSRDENEFARARPREHVSVRVREKYKASWKLDFPWYFLILTVALSVRNFYSLIKVIVWWYNGNDPISIRYVCQGRSAQFWRIAEEYFHEIRIV